MAVLFHRITSLKQIKQTIKCVFAAAIICGVQFTTSFAEAATLSKSQMEAFRKLPASQQQALAKQYGVDLSVLMGGQANQQTTQDYSDKTYMPRKDDDVEEIEDFDQQFAPKSKELPRFGLDLFAGEPTTFEPLESVPVPADYVLAAGDALQVILYGKVNEEHTLNINREGVIALPNMPPLAVVGLRFSEAQDLIKQKVSANMIGAKATVSMAKLRSIRVFVLGESYKPGAYTISSLSSITHALMASGGISEIGSLRNIQLKRQGQVVAELDLYDLLIRGDNSNDRLLRANDVVFIPAAGDLVSVHGQVRREAVYEMKSGETFSDLVKMAGGFHSTAYPNSSLIERFSGGNLRTLVNLDLSMPVNLAKAPVNGDRLTVPAVSEQYKEAVSVIGAVVRPGKLQWQDGMRISDVLGSVHGDLLLVADLDYALLVRRLDASGRIKIMQFNPIAAIERRLSSDNFVLEPQDKLVIFSRFETKESENRMLDKYAYTEQELTERQQEQLWERYQHQKFVDYVGAKLNKDVSDEELNRTEFYRANQSLMDITRQNSVKKLKEKDYALFSRRRLLAPIVLKLKEQASAMEPVKLVEIDGHVRYPGVYPLSENGRVTDLVRAAGGVTESAYLENAELTRVHTSSEGTRIEHKSSKLGIALAERYGSEDFTLQSKDRLNILSIPNWQENVSVKLTGEVKFPGTYTIRRGEYLSNVIKRAGGFTDFAEPRAAVFARHSLRKKERQSLNKLEEDLKRNIAAKSFQNNTTLTASVSYAETKQLLADLSSVEAVGRLVIDLDRVEDKSADIQLENGDHLHIPQLIQSVNVIGEVNVATAHMYEEGVSVRQYIDRSGGFKQRADEERVYIIKANGSVVIPKKKEWFAVNLDVPLETGDTIVVPLDAEYMDDLTLWSTATQILYQLGIAAAAIGSL